MWFLEEQMGHINILKMSVVHSKQGLRFSQGGNLLLFAAPTLRTYFVHVLSTTDSSCSETNYK